MYFIKSVNQYSVFLPICMHIQTTFLCGFGISSACRARALAFKLSFKLLSIIVYKSQEDSTIKRTLNIALLVEMNASFYLNTQEITCKEKEG